MYCSEMEDLLLPYMDHELPPEETPFVEKHLAQCPKCRQSLADFEKTSYLIKSLPNVPMPPGFQAKLHDLLQTVEQDTFVQEKRAIEQNWFRRIFAGSYRLVSAALVFFVCIVAYSLSTEYKNIPQMEQVPAQVSGEFAVMDAGADLQATEKANIDEKEENFQDPQTPKALPALPFYLLLAASLLIGIYIYKFRRKH